MICRYCKEPIEPLDSMYNYKDNFPYLWQLSGQRGYNSCYVIRTQRGHQPFTFSDYYKLL